MCIGHIHIYIFIHSYFIRSMERDVTTKIAYLSTVCCRWSKPLSFYSAMSNNQHVHAELESRRTKTFSQQWRDNFHGLTKYLNVTSELNRPTDPGRSSVREHWGFFMHFIHNWALNLTDVAATHSFKPCSNQVSVHHHCTTNTFRIKHGEAPNASHYVSDFGGPLILWHQSAPATLMIT